MPPHVLMVFVVFPPGHGSSVTDFRSWDAHEAQLRDLKYKISNRPCNYLVEAPIISGQSALRSALRSDRPYPQEIFLVFIPVRGWVDSAAGRIMSKNFNEPATFRIAAPCPNQLRQRVPPFSRYFSVHHQHHHHHHISVMELRHLLTRSGLTYPEVSS
jgi:hypothetical protein